MDDYLELPLYIEDLPEDKTIDLWVMSSNSSILAVFKNVDSCIRYKGWWSISHRTLLQPMTALLPADAPLFFNVLERDADV